MFLHILLPVNNLLVNIIMNQILFGSNTIMGKIGCQVGRAALLVGFLGGLFLAFGLQVIPVGYIGVSVP